MSLLTSNTAAILRPEQVAALVVQPIRETSIASQISTVVTTDSTSMRFPIVKADVTSAWTAEGSDITPADADTDELDVVPKKLAALTKISRELAADSSPAAQTLVGQSIARDMARKLDLAYFGNTVSNGPSGLESLNDISFVDTDTYPLTDLDAFAAAIADAEEQGAMLTAFACNATTALTLAQLKTDTDSNQPLLQPDATMATIPQASPDGPPLGAAQIRATRRSVLGVPLFVVHGNAIPDNVIWGVDRSRVFIVLRNDFDLVVDPSFYFGSDSLAVRATVRIGFAFPHERSVIKIAPEPGT